jgi:quinol monooxygenase YgiN
MALIALCQAGNFVHVYDFRAKPGKGEELIRLFDEFDYSDANPMHKSKAQAKDGVLCRDVNDPDHLYLLGEWKDIKAHAEILKVLQQMHPKFVDLIEGGPAKFKPVYAEVVSSTPQHLLDKASAAE